MNPSLSSEGLLKRLQSLFMVLVPGEEARDNDAGVEGDWRALFHQPLRSRNSLRTHSTTSSVSGSPGSTGTATRKEPFRTSFTARGAGSISILPSCQVVARGTPERRPARSRIDLGINRRPASSLGSSLGGFMPGFYPR